MNYEQAQKGDLLTEDELDALVTRVKNGDVETDSGREVEGELRLVDFAKYDFTRRNRFPVLKWIHEQLATNLNSAIYELLGRDVEISLESLKIERYTNRMCQLKRPSAITAVHFHPLRGKALLCFDAELVFALVENYFGGDGRYQSFIEDREFTVSERRVTDIILEVVLRELESVWQPIKALKLESLGFEMNPQLVSVVAPDDLVITTTFDVSFREGGGQFTVMIPYTMLEPIRGLLEAESTQSDDDIDPNWTKALKAECLNVPLELSAELANTTTSLREVTKLKVGDIIPIVIPEQVVIDVVNVPTFTAKYERHKDKCALQIIDKLER